MKKRIFLALCLLLALGLTCALAQSAAVHTSGDYRYRVLPDGSAEIVAYGGTSPQLTIPATLDGLAVTAIGNDAFSQCDFLTRVTLPAGVTSIGDGAFTYCYGLMAIALPDSVVTIGDGAFSDCKSLSAITLPQGLTAIGDSTFYGCKSLTSVTIPDGVVSIGDGAFYACEGLTRIFVPTGVVSIGAEAFFFCDSLTEASLPGSVTFIGDRAFAFCPDTMMIAVPSGSYAEEYFESQGMSVYPICNFQQVHTSGDFQYIILSDGTAEIHDYLGLAAALVIPAELDGIPVSSIGYNAFNLSDSLISVTIPEGVTSIAAQAFSVCRALTDVTLPDSLASIGSNPFESCTVLRNIHISADHPLLATIDGVLFNKAEKKLICYPMALAAEAYSIPQGIRIIGAYAFSGNSHLTTVTIPDSVVAISDRAFTFCEALSAITIPDSVTSIGANPFYGCFALTDLQVAPDNPALRMDGGVLITRSDRRLVTYLNALPASHYAVPQGVASIGDSAFTFCLNLTSVTIPDSVTHIGNMAFLCCYSLESATLPASITFIGQLAFAECNPHLAITTPSGSVTAQYCQENGIPCVYSDANDWLLN